MTRDLGSDILINIAESNDAEILVANSLNFAADSLFCEWGYVIDLDTNSFEIFEGFVKEPLEVSERFFSADQKNGYYPIKLVKKYNLDSLPKDDEFIKDLNHDEE